MKPKASSMVTIGTIITIINMALAGGCFLFDKDKFHTLLFMIGTILWIIGTLIWSSVAAQEQEKQDE